MGGKIGFGRHDDVERIVAATFEAGKALTEAARAGEEVEDAICIAHKLVPHNMLSGSYTALWTERQAKKEHWSAEARRRNGDD